MAVLQSPQQGILHHYAYNLTAFEFTTHPHKVTPNVLIVVAGLGDGLLNVPWIPPLAAQLDESNEDKKPSKRWSVVQAVLRSSYDGWGTSSIEQDIKDLSKLVSYIRSQPGRAKVVLGGHSTGCQDTLAYLSSQLSGDKSVDGGILQAGVSDVEAMNLLLPSGELERLCSEIEQDYLSNGREHEILPPKFRKIAFNTPITASRFYSIAKKGGIEDFFSPDLTDEDHKRTWGKVNKPILVLPGGKDEFVVKTTDQNKLLQDWQAATKPEYWTSLSHVIKGANHKIDHRSDEGAVEDAVSAIIKFLDTLS